MITKKYIYHPEADFDALSRKVRLWADRKQFGIQHSFVKSTRTLSVDYWTVEEDGPDHGGSAKQIEVAHKSLERILARCALKPSPPPAPVVVPPELLASMEWGFKAAERGINLEKAVEEFTKIYTNI